MKLTDSQGKAILLNWPFRTKSLWRPPSRQGYWLRAAPSSGIAAYPHLKSPGSTVYKTNPDGIYVFFHGFKYCDVVCIEVCGTGQNLNDKRSRYSLASHSLLLEVPKEWLFEKEEIQNGQHTERWQAAKCFPRKPQNRNLCIPVRHLSVLYSLEDRLYACWKVNHSPVGHEYYCRHSSLSAVTGTMMRNFLKVMGADSHFMTKK